MRSSIAWALLGLVIERPSYGWELVQRFRRAYGDTLALSSSARIYIALDSLIAHSLIEEISVEITDAGQDSARMRRPKPHYRASKEGVRAYEEWLLLQIEEHRQRQRLFTRQLAMLEPNAALEVIDRYEQECLAETDEVSPAQTEREGVAKRLADEDEHLSLEAQLEWIRYARHELTVLVKELPADAKSKRKAGDQ
jgi:DNA-binding PadR family transcriptional regulator